MGKKPHVVMLLDESGSMYNYRNDVINTVDEYVGAVENDKSAKTISIYTFDCRGLRNPRYKVRLDEFVSLSYDEYKPTGMTPLYDSIAQVIRKFEGSKRPVQLIIHTDGADTASVWHNFSRVQKLIESVQAKGWLVTFLAEGLNGKEALKDFKGLKMNMGALSRSAAMSFAASTTTTYMQSGDASMSNYTKDGKDTVEI